MRPNSQSKHINTWVKYTFKFSKQTKEAKDWNHRLNENRLTFIRLVCLDFCSSMALYLSELTSMDPSLDLEGEDTASANLDLLLGCSTPETCYTGLIMLATTFILR